MDEELEPFDDLAAFDETDPQDDQGQQPDEQADPAAQPPEDIDDLDDQPQQSRGQRQHAELRRRAQEAEDRERALRTEMEQIRNEMRRGPVETPQQRQERLDAMLPEERVEYLLNERLGQFEQRMQAQQAQAAEREDKTNFEVLCRTNATAAKFKDKVEAKLQELRREGNAAPREVLLKYLVGEAMLEKAPSAARKQKSAAEGRKAAQAAAPTGSRGDVSSRGSGNQDDRSARRARLENMQI